MTNDDWTKEERAQWAEVSAEYDAASDAVDAAEKRLDDAVEVCHAAGERMLLRLLRERNEAVAKLAAVERERAVEMYAASGSNVALDRAMTRADEARMIARVLRGVLADIVARCNRDGSCLLCGNAWGDDPQAHAGECGAGEALRSMGSLAWFLDDVADPPATLYLTRRLASGAEVLVREHAQRPSLVVEIPLAEMTSQEGRDIASAMLRVCRSLDAQARDGEKEGLDS